MTINWNSGTLINPTDTVMQSGGTIIVSDKGAQITLAGGNDTIIAEDKVANLNISATSGPPANLNLEVSGVVAGTLSPNGSHITITPVIASTENFYEQAVSLSDNGAGQYGGSAGTVTFDMPDIGGVVSIGEARGTLEYGTLAFLQDSSGISFNDGFGPDGVNLPAGISSPNGATFGNLPTLEIDNLNPLKDVQLTQTSLTLDFQDGCPPH
jgi:hypothetical protein